MLYMSQKFQYSYLTLFVMNRYKTWGFACLYFNFDL